MFVIKTKKIISTILIISITILMMPMLSFAASNDNNDKVQEIEKGAKYVEGEVLVYYDENASPKNINKYLDEKEIQDSKETTDYNNNFSVIKTNDDNIKSAMKELSDSNIVEYVQPNYIYSLSDSVDNIDTNLLQKSNSSCVNDVYSDYMWHFDDINIKDALDEISNTELNKVKVAVIDTGVNLSHSDIQTCINKDLCKNATRETITPLSTVPTDDLTTDYIPEYKGDIDISVGHGSNVCSIIAATANNQKGTAGVASTLTNNNVELMAINVFQYYDTNSGAETKGPDSVQLATSSADAARGIYLAKAQGAKVINLSFGSYSNDKIQEDAVNDCVNSGIVVVGAAGNDNKTNTHYPSDCNDVISVIATEYETDTNKKSVKKASYSNYGSQKDISAPGTRIPGMASGYEYDYLLMSGTSQAAPIVSSIACVLFEIDPTLTVDAVKQYLYNNTNDLYTAGKDDLTGYGVIDAHKSIDNLLQDKKTQTNPIDPNSPDNPTNPGDQNNPDNPSDSDNPSDPGNENNPSNPNNPDDPSDPGDENNPDNPSDSDDPSDPGESTPPNPPVDPEPPVIKNPDTPFLNVNLYNQYKTVKLTWNKIDDADEYLVYYKSSKEITWNEAYTQDLSLIKDLPYSGTSYMFKIKAIKHINNNIYYSDNSPIKTLYTLKTPTLSVKKRSQSSNILTWTKVSGASGYKIYRKTVSGVWTCIKNCSSGYSSYLDTKSIKNITYYYKIKAYRYSDNSYIYTPYSTTKGAYMLCAPKITIKKYTSSSIKVSWGKVSRASGYKIYRKTSKSSWVLIKTLSSKYTKYIDHNKKKKTYYYYKVRAYEKGTYSNIYSSYSSTKRVRI